MLCSSRQNLITIFTCASLYIKICVLRIEITAHCGHIKQMTGVVKKSNIFMRFVSCMPCTVKLWGLSFMEAIYIRK